MRLAFLIDALVRDAVHSCQGIHPMLSGVKLWWQITNYICSMFWEHRCECVVLPFPSLFLLFIHFKVHNWSHKDPSFHCRLVHVLYIVTVILFFDKSNARVSIIWFIGGECYYIHNLSLYISWQNQYQRGVLRYCWAFTY